MSLDRKRLSRIGVALAAIAVTGFVAAPVQAEPNIDDVQAKVDRLYHEAEQAQESYHDANLKLEALTEDLSSLKADEKRQDARLDAVREQVQESIVRQYQGEGISTVGQVVVSEDPSAFLGQLSTMSAFNDLQADLFDSFSTEAEALDIRREATRDRHAEIQETTQELSERKDEVEAKLAEAKRVLGRLEAEERERLLASRSAGSTRLPASVPASGRAAIAVKTAMAQVGDAYVYGASGPSAWDCSGLTMVAWGAAGVGLPHSSSAQFSSGARVSQNDLQPGDLVFYYSPISHVGMYIGNGLIVHAANPGAGVKVDGVFSMPYVGAVRPG